LLALYPREEIERVVEPLRPVEPLLQWVERVRIIADKQSGRQSRFSLEGYPWLRHLYESQTRERWVRKCTQFGLTEWQINYGLWAIMVYRARVFTALPPGVNMAGDFTADRLDPALNNSAGLALPKVDNVGLKTWAAGGAWYVRASFLPRGKAERAAALSSVPVDVLLVDEVDRIPPGALPVLRGRLEASAMQVVLGVSTPTYPGAGIDREYAESCQYEAEIHCVCGKWLPVTWSLVDGRGDKPRLRCKCGRTLDVGLAWATGGMRWAPRRPELAGKVDGYWFNRLLSPRADLGVLWRRSTSADEKAVQAFYNNDLGMAYEPKGSRLTGELLEACASGYEYEMPDTARNCAMGVDVQGWDLHVYIKRRAAQQDPALVGREQAVFIGTVPDFEDLDGLMQRYDVGRCVIDANPEGREARRFVGRWKGRAFLCYFNPGVVKGREWTQWDFGQQKVLADRTSALEESHGKVENRVDMLPRNWRALEFFEEQMCANIRIRTEDSQGRTVYRYENSSRPDHFGLAKGYADVAMTTLPPDPDVRAAGQRVEVPRAGKARWGRQEAGHG